jgi:hypothetical protein
MLTLEDLSRNKIDGNMNREAVNRTGKIHDMSLHGINHVCKMELDDGSLMRQDE